jgi:cobalamin synthase
VAAAVAGAAAMGVAALSRRLIGGVAGDALGAGQTLGEALALGVLAAALAP